MIVLELLKVILLGIVEGITEWLPISSTGHMMLVDEFVKLSVSPEFMEVFLVVIQLGAILAVVILFWNKLWPFHIRELSPAAEKKIEAMPSGKRPFAKFVYKYCHRGKWNLWFKIIIACIPTILIAIPFDDFIDEHLNNYLVLSIALIVYGILFIAVENYNENRVPTTRSLKELSFKTALFIGLFQTLAVIPGTSRSGSTILGAMLLGVKRTVAVEFTFFLAIPVMAGASLLKLVKYGFAFSGAELLYLAVGCITAFLVSFFTIKALINYIKTHDFKIFGCYRIILGIVVMIYFGVKNGGI
ncbi:MAG: undecaprenyl-diphosphate phosphatase [Blautia sp.]|nr:undecaprenyl-diphosphate phosphatase [Blautia sp.]